MGKPIDKRASFGFIRYANCWEDAGLLLRSLQPDPGKRILSIGSAGDNALSLVADGAEVVAVDLNRAQLACIEIRRAAIRRLDYVDLLKFLGVSTCHQRFATYRSLRSELGKWIRSFWDDKPDVIAKGIIHGGKFERFFKVFRTRVLPLIHGRGTVMGLLEEKNAESRIEFYKQTWDNWRWRILFRVFFSRYVMGHLGRDPEFFRYVKGDVAENILNRTRDALTLIPTHNNPYLRYILTGNYKDVLPHYLIPANVAKIRDHLDNLTIRHGSITDVIAASPKCRYDGFNLSDIFEYIGPDTTADIYGALLDVANKGARLAYWNMLVPRRCPHRYQHQVTLLDDLSRTLFSKDQAFFYSRFVVEEVL